MKKSNVHCLLMAGFAGLASPAMAQTDYSAMIAEKGLTATAEALEKIGTPTADDRFALGAVHFLRGIERAYQTRWQVGFTEGDFSLPMLQGQLPQNPDPQPFKPETLREIFSDALTDMARAEAVLASIPDMESPVVQLSLPDLWFDLDMDGKRGKAEGFGDLMLQAMMSPWEIGQMQEAIEADPDAPNPLEQSIRFDKADLFWLRAYIQAISGTSEVLLAFDPTREIARVMETRAAIIAQIDVSTMLTPEDKTKLLANIRTENPDKTEAELEEILENLLRKKAAFDMRYTMEGWWIDLASVVIETIRHQPDPKRIAAARDHFLNMTQLNYRFWQELALETDNELEWIPNPSQEAVLGFTLPEGTAEAWMAVLQDGEAVLKGEKLIPFWRFGPGFGVDLAAYVDNPKPLPIVEWFQGSAAIDFARKGDVLTDESWRQFRQLTGRQAGLFAILLN